MQLPTAIRGGGRHESHDDVTATMATSLTERQSISLAPSCFPQLVLRAASSPANIGSARRRRRCRGEEKGQRLWTLLAQIKTRNHDVITPDHGRYCTFPRNHCYSQGRCPRRDCLGGLTVLRHAIPNLPAASCSFSPCRRRPILPRRRSTLPLGHIASYTLFSNLLRTVLHTISPYVSFFLSQRLGIRKRLMIDNFVFALK